MPSAMPDGMPSAADALAGSARGPKAAEVLRGMRGALASLRAATETLQGYPHAETAMRERLLAVIADETARLSSQLQSLERTLVDTRRVEPGRRAPVPAEEVARALADALSASGLECDVASAGAGIAGNGTESVGIDAGSRAGALMTLRVDLGAITHAAGAFFTALRRQSPFGSCTLHRALHERHLLLDVRWSPAPADIPRLLAWQGEALGAGASNAESGGLRVVVREHDGEAWFALDRDGTTASIRILLPSA